jgi:hypothetical protein
METGIAVIDVSEKFPASEYNALIPVKTITQMSPFHRVSVNIVSLSPDPKDGDVYDLKGKLAPQKNGLMKLAAAAGIRVISVRSVTPSGCERCMEAASRTKIPPACRECPDREDIAVEAVVDVPDGAGGYRPVKATREWLAEDEREAAKSNAATFLQAKRFRKPLTESKALLRAIRSALSVHATYTAEELRKPFVVPVVTLNYDDPALREAVVKRLAAGADAVFGAAPTALPEVAADCFDADADVLPADADEEDGALTAEAEEAPHSDFCESCGAPITGCKTSKKQYTPEEWVTTSVTRYGRIYCPKCATAEEARMRGEGA